MQLFKNTQAHKQAVLLNENAQSNKYLRVGADVENSFRKEEFLNKSGTKLVQ